MYSPLGGLYATPTQLIVGLTTDFTIAYQTTSGPGTDSDLHYTDVDGTGGSLGQSLYGGRIETSGSGLLASFFASPPVGMVTASYPWQGNNSEYDSGWVIATAASVPLPGDANRDGTVNGSDLNTVLSNYDQSGMTWDQGDFNGDGTVNGGDLNTVLSNYNQSVRSNGCRARALHARPASVPSGCWLTAAIKADGH